MKPPTKPRIGILGAGQLALMLAEAGNSLDVQVVCAGRRGDCAESVAQLVEVELGDEDAVAQFAAQVDVVTIESENIDACVLQHLNLSPNAHAIGIAQDRLLEKRFFEDCGVEVAPYAAVNCLEDFVDALATTGLPAILKTRRMGYDGKGQVRLHRAEDATAAWQEVEGVPCIVEGMLSFDAEVSLIAARNAKGKIAFYSLIENVHSEGILRVSSTPYSGGSQREALQGLAETYLIRLLEALDYVGVLAVEFFVLQGRLVANELAPRVHNSGHWTIEGAKTSQFENHLRAVLNMDLGSTESHPTVMLNCIGTMPPASETAKFPALRRHDYGKAARPGRKVGHLTCAATERATIDEWLRRLTDA